MAPRRPYVSKSAKELRTLFESVRYDMATLRLIFSELKHRSTSMALTLRNEVGDQLALLKQQKKARQSPSIQAEKPSSHMVVCDGCNVKISVPFRPGELACRCPRCKASFKVINHGNVVTVSFSQKTKNEAPHEACSEDSARSILGVSSTASFTEVKNAWRLLSQQYHPDKHQGLPERLRKAADSEMQRINTAYQVLSRALAESF